MKVVFKQMIGGYTGTVDGVIFYWDSRLKRILARSVPKVRITQNHIDFGNIARNLMGIEPTERYKDDLRTYAERTWKLPEFGGIRPNWNNLYLKVMYGLRKLDPALDLATISRAYIQYHIDFGNIARNLMGIEPTERYKDDLRTYAERTWKLPVFGGIMPNWNNLYMKIMYGLRKLDPAIDLATISRAYIQYHDLPCRTVRRAIEAGLLPEVRGYQELDSEL